MPETYRYGVFQVGQVWCVVCEGQPELGFPSREAALAAIGVLREAHHLVGEGCEVFTLDAASRLVEVADGEG